MNLALKLPKNRAGVILLFYALAIGISMILRVALMIKSWADLDFSFLTLAGIFFLGLVSDVLSTSYAAIPLAFYLWLVPQRFFETLTNKYILNGLFFIIIFLLLFGAAAEWFFWDEFSGRFNFIAVDYLVYTTEVIGNITQSYPIGWLVTIMVILSSVGVWFLQPAITSTFANPLPFQRRSVFITVYGIVVYLFFLSFSNQYHRFSNNQYANELAGNGLYELFSAYRHNELNYDQFYASVETQKAFTTLRSLLKTPEATFTSNNPMNLERLIQNPGPEKKLNVVLISVESFSADFMSHFGSKKNITPFLDSLAEHSLFFTNLYATGTRTVRGLEALSLCIPPTPGQSIVRRPGNEGLFSLGKVFHEKGYRSEYIYGGYGYFDNMNYFFSNNSYEVTDRTALKDSEIDYENIWGVADENLFSLAIKNMDVHTAQKPVFAHIMTTSNHRPFTYPDGRIDIPSHTGRKGAVKYTDYAIAKFIREASKKPWFNNTVFIIVADHCASSAGKTELPIEKYHIPMLIYSPANIQPGVMDRLMSQIDIGPTLLGLLNFSYTSKFFGYDMNKLEPGRERAFISTYQSLGYVKNHELIVLSPQFKTESFSFTASTGMHAVRDSTAMHEAIAWYQSASYAFGHGLLK